MRAALLQWGRKDFPVGSYPRSIAFDGANVWVGNGSSNTISRIRASDGAQLPTINFGSLPGGFAFDGENMWVSDPFRFSLFRLRPSDGAIVGSASVAGYPQAIAFDGTAIWVANLSGNN